MDWCLYDRDLRHERVKYYLWRVEYIHFREEGKRNWLTEYVIVGLEPLLPPSPLKPIIK